MSNLNCSLSERSIQRASYPLLRFVAAVSLSGQDSISNQIIVLVVGTILVWILYEQDIH